MLIALLLALVAQETKAMEEIRGIAIAPPAGWKRTDDAAQRTTQLMAPGLAAGQEAALMVYPVTPTPAATPETLHEQVCKGLAQTWKVNSEGGSGRSGDWHTTLQQITLPNGIEAWTKVYTTKSGANGAFIIFFATSDELFKTHVAAADKAVGAARIAAPSAGAAIEVNGLDLTMPPGWTRKDDPKSGSIAFMPPPPRGPLDPTWDYVMHVLARQPLKGTLSETHRALVDDVVKSAGLKNPATTLRADGPGPFIMSGIAGHDAQGVLRQFTLYSARSEGHAECVLIQNQEDMDTVRGILARAMVRNPVKAGRPKIVEAYRRTNMGPLKSGNAVYGRIWLRSDGVADFTRTYLEGHALASAPLKYDKTLLNGDVGAWTSEGNVVRITRAVGAKPEEYRREGGKLVKGDEVWQPMPPVEDVKLEGRFGWKSNPGAEPFHLWIEFTKDGRFRDEGVIAHVGSLDHWNKPKPKGAGTYELRDYTVFLKYEDGTVWTTDFSTLGADVVNPAGIMLRTYAFAKE